MRHNVSGRQFVMYTAFVRNLITSVYKTTLVSLPLGKVQDSFSIFPIGSCSQELWTQNKYLFRGVESKSWTFVWATEYLSNDKRKLNENSLLKNNCNNNKKK